jgi:farnesyl diphosphate synthase
MSYQFGTELKQVQDRINQFLANQFEEIDSYNAPLRDAMKYGLLLGGKRVLSLSMQREKCWAQKCPL